VAFFLGTNMKRLLSVNEIFGIATYLEDDPDDPEKFYIRDYQRDCSPLIEANKKTQILQREHKPKGVMELAASIPMNIYMDWHKQGITEDKKYMNRLLNDEYSAFKASEKKL
jgi:hypothetical protein